MVLSCLHSPERAWSEPADAQWDRRA